jgi:hypothetical protein
VEISRELPGDLGFYRGNSDKYWPSSANKHNDDNDKGREHGMESINAVFRLLAVGSIS